MELNSVKEPVGVLVVGAGPTGLALALDLARHGVRALVVERSAALFPGSRGKGIQPRTQEVFDDFGVLDALRASGGQYPVGMIWKDGRRQGEHRMFDEVAATEAEPYAGSALMVPQWRTQEILFARLEELGGSVAFGRELAGLVQDADGVTATFTDGAPVRARYAVAADGGRSAVRRALGIGMTGETVDPAPALVADIRVTGLDRDNWHFFPPTDGAGGGAGGGGGGGTGGSGGGHAGLLAICPLPRTEDFQLMAGFADPAAEPDLSLDGIRKLVATRTHLTEDDVTEVRWASDFRPRAALADRFRQGRVFLAGDAAHIHSPAGGQGLNTSVQDAYNLAWKFAAVLRGNAPAALLDSYEEERRPVAAQMLGLSTGVHRGEVRRGAATQQLGLGYRGSPLTVETRTDLPEEALRAGDRAPDGIRGGVRLFDAFRGPHWTLLAVGTDTGVPDLPGARTVRVPAYEAYGAGLFLVRPDGYVGWAGGSARELARYAALVGLALPGPAGNSARTEEARGRTGSGPGADRG
ncbi:2-polyprenyl-6-methoxyphenol hydroxylase-like FAD-dependent oxidoreductase [Streptomyces sp. V3I8]|uniref:FAD-dependent monooxygenase n=1 Tax=Streptomyces sp. V3I8 TaxID=3042279 RepID=UPI002786EE08|nr:FAD-dependent monooxygenase [Streptomyces sp. V3I8]MDQ1036563.1 2-polyprenyl-6-methoxyphenol hydroxylase-like FAD-dependent oxidoreductase [Streptomyces sp. V3I8]